jgi:3-oxoacyl-[acyl-carrier-protein] synthase II
VTPRLWITGLGLMTPLGADVETTWRALVQGQRAIAPITLFDASGQRSHLAAQVACVPVASPVGGGSRTSAMAVRAAREAVGWARLDVRGRRVGLVVGGTTGGMFETEELLALLHAEPERKDVFPQMLAHPLTATSERLNEALGPFCRIRTLSSACSSGANAIVAAASWLLDSDLDAVVAGGSDALCRLTVTGFNALGVLDPEPCRPFDLHRRGTSLGEGAGFVVIERAQDAMARGTLPVVELAGWALGSEAHHITNPLPDGGLIAELIETALDRAGLSPSDVDYVSAHGTGTPASDAAEASALTKALGAEIRRIPVSSSKAQIGHTLGAAGAIEAAISALTIRNRTLVPTAGLVEPDPAMKLVHVPRVGHPVERVRVALSNAFGFGGMDTVLVLSEPARPVPVAGRAAPVVVRERAIAPVITGVAALGPWGLRSGAECANLMDGAPAYEAAPFDAEALLDPVRGRRLDKIASLATVAAECALRDAKAPVSQAGLVLGNAFGNVDRCAAFLHRVFQAGPRSASPAEFPNLVPSSPVGHASIYLGLHGPAFAVSDLATSGQSAFAQAVQLLASGEASCMVAGAAEPHSDIGDRVLANLFVRGGPWNQVCRPDLAAAIVLETGAAAAAREAPILAKIDQVVEWQDNDDEAWNALRGPATPAAEVLLLGVPSSRMQKTGWAACKTLVCDSSMAASDAWGGVAIAIAASRIASRRIGQALILTNFSGRGIGIALLAA